MERINFYKKPRLKNPCLIVAWPGMGEVAVKAANFLIDKLKAEEFAEIPPEEFFYLVGSKIENGILDLPELPYSKFYFWKDPAARRGTKSRHHDLIIFVSDAQPDLAKAEEYCQRIMDLAKEFKVKRVVGFAAMPQAIDHIQNPGVWITATSVALLDNLKKLNLENAQVLNEGQISGLNGLFLGMAAKEGMEGFCLLGEIPLYTIQIENPKASHAVLEAAIKILDIQVELSELIEQSHNIEEQINKLLDFLKSGSAVTPPIGEEEIEKIKHSLSQLTKLPQSIKEKIEKLFQEAKTDISKANLLKAELDNWNVYREYEDRFLDLFKKSKSQKKDQNN
ncbi:MAG: PAC2 family protein [Candidatus Omnitrophica bacterium]|nr:PAC2 family protein [Candidatus Omnitrophota bacterium]